MNMKKIILAATTFIMASTLSTGVMAQDALDTITSKATVFRNSKYSNVVKFFRKSNKIYVAGIYMIRNEGPGAWTGTCISKKDRKLTCQYITNKDKKGTITFDVSDTNSLTSSHRQSGKKVDTQNTWTQIK